MREVLFFRWKSQTRWWHCHRLPVSFSRRLTTCRYSPRSPRLFSIQRRLVSFHAVQLPFFSNVPLSHRSHLHFSSSSFFPLFLPRNSEDPTRLQSPFEYPPFISFSSVTLLLLFFLFFISSHVFIPLVSLTHINAIRNWSERSYCTPRVSSGIVTIRVSRESDKAILSCSWVSLFFSREVYV